MTQHICVICGKETSNNNFLFDEEKNLTKYGVMFKECLYDEIQPDSGYPQHICHYCGLQLNMFYEFRQAALNMYEQLRNEIAACGMKVEEIDNDVIESIEYDEQIDEKQSIEYVDEDASQIDDYDTYDVLIAETDEVELLENESQSNSNDEFIKSVDRDSSVKDIDELTEFIVDEPDSSEFYDIEELSTGLENDDGAEFLDEIKTDNHSNMVIKSNKKLLTVGKGDMRCEMCNKKCKNTEALLAHMNIHEGLPPYQCSFCDRGFSAKSLWRVHENRHKDIRDHPCSLCDKSFKSKWDLEIHIRVHRDIRLFACDICSQRFRVHSHLVAHIETHATQRTYKCDYCGLMYKTRLTLKSHVQAQHLQKDLYPCHLCGKSYGLKFRLKRHLITHAKKDKEIKNEAILRI